MPYGASDPFFVAGAEKCEVKMLGEFRKNSNFK